VVLCLFSLFIFISCTANAPNLTIKETYNKWRSILENQTAPQATSQSLLQAREEKKEEKEEKKSKNNLGNQTASQNATQAKSTLQPKTEIKEEKSELKPKLVSVSPLQKRINITFHQEYYENILSFLSIQAGLSFILDPEVRKVIPEDKAKLSFQFVNQPLEEIIKKVCEVLDIYPKVEKGVLYILPYEERIFNLGFLPVVKESRANLGGDVLGNIATTTAGGGASLSSPLKGEFSVSSELSRGYLEIYRNLEQTVRGMLSKSGMYQLNLSAGILYVKDRPSNVQTIDKFIKEFSARYRKQIILDAQIIEVELNKEHTFGIDWFQITNYLLGNNKVSLKTLDLSITPRTDQPSVSLTISGYPNVNTLINFLKQYGELKVLQNPKLRVLHSQPAIISVGTTYSYIKEFKRDTTTGTTSSVVTYTTQTSSVFDGILLGIVPYLSENDEIYLHIVPIKSELVELKNVKFGLDYFITLPTVNLREMSSIIRAKTGDLIIIGGLILDKQKDTEKRVALPLLENIFRSQESGRKLTELVIVIRLMVD
jgi:MSHA type pilus biogenesis protein MshL